MDMPEAEENLKLFKEHLAADGREMEIYPISALARQGVQELLYKIADLLESIPEQPPLEELSDLSERKVYRLEKRDDNEFTIRRENDVFVVESPAIEKLLKRTNFSSYEAAMRFANILRKMGVDHELRKRGAVDGQIIRIGDMEFEFMEKE
jgi:GTP-binding protein